MPVIYSYLQVKLSLKYPFLFMFTLLKNGENVKSPSTILTARLQHVSSDSVITNRFKHVSVAIHVSIGPSAILYFNAKMHVTRLPIGWNKVCSFCTLYLDLPIGVHDDGVPAAMPSPPLRLIIRNSLTVLFNLHALAIIYMFNHLYILFSLLFHCNARAILLVCK